MIANPAMLAVLTEEQVSEKLQALNTYLQGYDSRLGAKVEGGTLGLYYGPLRLLTLTGGGDRGLYYEATDLKAEDLRLYANHTHALVRVQLTQGYLGKENLTAEQRKLAEAYLAKATREEERQRRLIIEAAEIERTVERLDLQFMQQEWIMRLSVEWGYQPHYNDVLE